MNISKKTLIFEFMKILFVGDASNMHNCLAHTLRDMGHEAVVASNGSRWMNTERDINLYRRPGMTGAVRYMIDIIKALPQMQGYDIVEIASPIFLNLKPGKIRYIFDYLKKHNKKIVLSALGTDYNYYKACHDGHTFRYSDYMVGNKPSPYMQSSESIAQRQGNWELPMMRDYSNYITTHIDGAVACLYEYYATYRPILGDRAVYAGIPIDTTTVTPHYIEEAPEKVKFFIGIQRDRNVVKGSDRLLAALKRLKLRYPDNCEADVVENLPYKEYIERMSHAHVILDQLYSYTPATNALLAMAQGLIAVSGAEPEYYDLIGEHDNHPIINVSPIVDNDIDNKLEWLMENKSQLPMLSHKSRELVERHNAATVVAQRYLDFWEKILNNQL